MVDAQLLVQSPPGRLHSRLESQADLRKGAAMNTTRPITTEAELNDLLTQPRTELVEFIRQVRSRWRMKLLLRGWRKGGWTST